MFAKLLKHEWRATRSVVALLCTIILISGLVIGLTMGYAVRSSWATVTVYDATVMEGTARSDMVGVVCVLLMVAGIMALVICCAASIFFLIYRYYKRCFTDEGYLTFTLPVSSHQILLSSITNCILCELLVLAAAAVAAAIIGGIFLLAINSTQTVAWADVWMSWEDVRQQLWDSVAKNADRLALVGFSGITGALGELIVLMLAVTIGAMIAKKHKILAAVGVYYGIGMIESFILSMVSLSAVSTENANLMLVTPGIIGIALAVAGYFLMHWLISRKLNLV